MKFPMYEKVIQDDLKQFNIHPYPISDDFNKCVQSHQKFIYKTTKGGVVQKVVCISCNALYSELPNNSKGSSLFDCLFCGESARLFVTTSNELITKTDSYERLVTDTHIEEDKIIKEKSVKSLNITFNEFLFKLDFTNESFGEKIEKSIHSFTFKDEDNEFKIIYENKELNMSDLCKNFSVNLVKKILKTLSNNEVVKNLFGSSVLIKALKCLDGTFATRFADINVDYYYVMKKLNLFESFYLEKVLSLKEMIKKVFVVKSVSIYELIQLDLFIKKYSTDHLEVIFNNYTARYNILFAIFCFNKNYTNLEKINKWNSSLEGFNNRKLILVDIIANRDDFDSDVLAEYIDYLIQYEALPRTKAINNYVSYIKKQIDGKSNIKSIELYPKDILLKI